RAERLHQRFGALVLIVCRGVPVLAEASTVFAGALRMRLAHFMLVTSSANAGLALAYATLASLGTGIFALLAPFVLGIVLPALALLVVARLERARATRSGKPEHP
ncbi:MAG TPA: DedA family protein, partial [Polyangiaceae bacterium]